MQKLQRPVYWVFILFAVVVTVCLLINCFFIRAEADVYVYALITKKLGFAGAQKFWYTTWSGRIIPTLVLSLGEFFINNNLAYQFFAFFILLLSYLTLILFVKKCFVFQSTLERYFVTALFSLVLAQMFSSVPNMFYWLPATITYTVPFLAGLWSLYFLFHPNKILQMTGLLILFLFTLFNELNDLLMILLLAYLLFTQYHDKAFRKKIFAGILVAVTGTIILYAAPGNYAREEYHHGSLSYLGIFLYSNKALFNDLFHWCFNTPLLLGSFLLLFINSRGIEMNPNIKSRVSNKKILLILLMYASLLIPYGIFYKLSDGYPPERVINIVCCLFFIIALIAFSGWSEKIHLHSMLDQLNIHIKIYLIIVTVCMILYGFNDHSLNISSIITDASSGRGKQYFKEFGQQLQSLSESSSDTVHVQKINSDARSIRFNILNNDSTNFPYIQYCQYFNKKKIIVDE